MTRSLSDRDAFVSGGLARSSSSLVDRAGGRASVALEGEGEDADRLRALRSLRRKRSKPEDWMSGTFHQYDISDVVGAGTFGQVRGWVCTFQYNTAGSLPPPCSITGTWSPACAAVLLPLPSTNPRQLSEIATGGEPWGGKCLFQLVTASDNPFLPLHVVQLLLWRPGHSRAAVRLLLLLPLLKNSSAAHETR